ncbi:MAG: starch-binding protein [Ruminococcus sp.]|nr:starch-binding protein [Ruminococcus sp.]
MQNSLSKKRLLTKKVLPIVLVLTILLSTVIVAFSMISAVAAGVAQNEVIYFNLSKNSSWYTNGSGTLYARFFNGGVPVGNVVCSSQGSNVYKATAPAAADSVQLAVYNADTKKNIVLNDAKNNRVYYDNASKNWSNPYVYNWKDSGSYDTAWPGKAMTSLSGTMYYYDITKGSSYKYVIFSNHGSSQTADLTVPNDLAYWNGSAWVDIFSKSTSKLNLSGKASDANEIYLDGSNLVLSKYKYPNHNNRTMREVYVYNPNWTGNKVYVQYDLTDPYQGFFAMTKVSGRPAGFFKGNVPVDAEFKFFATTAGVGGSNQTSCPGDANLNCYKMGSGAETWVKLEDAQKITANYFADKKTTGDSNAKAFWVDATYYDYLTDAELTNGWLKPDKIGTFYSEANHNADKDCWYPFYQFNNYINGKTAGVTYPLFFGNFCNTDGSYPYNFLRNGGYGKAIEDLTNFNYIANNSNGLPLYNYSVQGLAANSLSSSGDIRFPNGTKMPYFQQQTATDNYAKSVQSYFPFRSSTVGSGNNQVTTYSFNSKGARDNVFFKWSNGTPASVNYGQGTNYGVQDGLADFEYTASRWGSSDGQNHPGYGIFPFNNKNNGNGNPGNGNPGNGKLDYGFGVRMDMNFRVPAGGVLPDGNDVKFSFTGDDDLWVYLSPVNDDGTIDYAKSQLALDLGGAHKEASGNINFRTMKSNVTYGSTIKSSNYGSDMMIIKDTSNWGKVSLWAWSDSVSGGWFDGVSMGNNEYYIKASTVGSNGKKFGEMKYFFINKGRSWDTVNTNTFKNNGNYEEWPGFTNSEGGQDRTPFLVQTHFGRRTYIDHGSYTEKLDSNWYTASSNKTADLNKSKLGVSSTLDPTKMYHMTVFYMERGLIESNASMEFTMTPAQNDYKVEKIVNTAKLNTGVASAMRAKDQFYFSTAGTYAGYAIERGDAKLANSEVKDYENQFDTNTNLQTTEGKAVLKNTTTTSTTQYTTSWVVADTDTGQVVAQSANGEDSKATSQFLLKRQDTSLDSIHLKSTFTNTPVTDNVTVKKQIVNEDNTPSDKIVTFNYTMKVDLDGSGSRYTYTAYPLDYTVGGHAAKMTSNGGFSFRSDQTVTVPNLPKNATFTIEEAKEAGFTPRQKTITGTVGTNKTIQFTNMVTPSKDKIQGIKKLNGVNYTGNMFTFRLEGLPAPSGATGYIDESSSTFAPITEITDGKIEFNLSYDSDDVGKHRYKFYEDTTALGDLGSDFNFTDNVWYVEVNVVNEGSDLEVQSIKYFRPVGYDNPADAATAPNPEVNINATFAGTPLTSAEFKNDVKPGSITVYKTDSAKRAVNGIKFHVYAVSGRGAEIPAGATPVDTKTTERKLAKKLDNNGQPIQEVDGQSQPVFDNDGNPVYVMEEQDGIAEFKNLDIYTDMTCPTFVSNPYQWYCLVEEYTDSNGYNKNEKKMYFKFPEEGKYDFIAPYVNGILKQPETSGWGSSAIKTAGITIMALAAVSFGVYMFYVRKPKRGKKRYAAKRYSK